MAPAFEQPLHGTLLSIGGVPYTSTEVTLSQSQLLPCISFSYQRTAQRVSCFSARRRSLDIHPADVLAVARLDDSHRWRFVHCPRSKSSGPRVRLDVEVEIDADAAWEARLNSLCCSAQQKRRFLVFINPAAGSGSAPRQWAVVEQLWVALPWLSWDVIVTTKPNHASQHLQAADLSSYDGIVIVSGDGLMHEAFNGLASRPDAAKALRMPVGHIPGGSGNAFAKSMLDHCGEAVGALDAAFLIARGGTLPVHVCVVHQPASPPRISCLSLAAAVISDVDLESERLRCLGNARFTVWALYRTMNPRALRAKLVYWPASATEVLPAEPPALDVALEDAPWKVVEDEFAVFWGLNLAWADVNSHVAPSMRPEDDAWDLVLIRGPTRRATLVRFLLAIGSGGHVQMREVEVIRCKAFRLTPLSEVGLLSLDGESVPLAPVQVWPCSHGSAMALGAPSAG
mmetsp:Transcript_44984/g.104051  ORF Transcript_44984/g.104051 Transcript_44984/m.104051 type:complete len:456 (-) Transcript_44984:106-1473(-)